MKRTFLAALMLAGLAFAQTTQSPAPKRELKPISELPYTPSLDVPSMDKAADPCVDFYQYACGGWKKRNPIPGDQAAWSVYGKLAFENQLFLWGILDEASKKKQRNAIETQIGDYFGACMDEAAIEKLGTKPFDKTIAKLNALKSKDELPAFIAREHLAMSTGSFLFGSGVEQDAKDSTRMIAAIYQGGIGLPDRDYYSKDGTKDKEIRDRYVQHVALMFEMLGDSKEKAAANAATVMRIETELANASLTRVERRNPYNVYHKMKVSELQQLSPTFNWTVYAKESGLADLQELNVSVPKFFQQVDAVVKNNSLDDLKTYLRWRLVDIKADLMPKRFQEADFNFFRKYLRGQKELSPRWRRCVQGVDNQLGEALGQAFVAKTFAADTKARAVDMTQRIQKVMEQRINALPWMGAETKKQALEKLHGMRNKIGYPDKWRDYSSVKITRNDFYGNYERSNVFESRRQLAKVGKPVERGEWLMTPPTVNAYYDPQMNDMNFPAGVLQPPLFDPKMDDAPNYGNTGGTIGHELVHGFDDEGRQFDAKGNLRDWWTRQDAEEFEKRAKCIRDQYSQYTVVDDIKLKGELTSGEDIADLGGLLIAYYAWRDAIANQRLQPVDGFTPDQRFFIGFAQWDCANETDENKRLNAVTNPHSPAWARINGVVVNMPEFKQAFSCKEGQPMVKADKDVCKIW